MREAQIRAETSEQMIRASTRFKGFRIVRKQESRFMWSLYYGALMPLWQPQFMTRYTTTVGNTIYLPRPLEEFGKGSLSDLVLLRHELQHMADSAQFGHGRWSVLYLFPQCLFPLFIFGIADPFWFLFGLALAPWPAPFRVWAEVRGYAESIETRRRYGVEISRQRYRKAFTGPAYYFMAWRWKAVDRQMKARGEELADLQN